MDTMLQSLADAIEGLGNLSPISVIWYCFLIAGLILAVREHREYYRQRRIQRDKASQPPERVRRFVG